MPRTESNLFADNSQNRKFYYRNGLPGRISFPDRHSGEPGIIEQSSLLTIDFGDALQADAERAGLIGEIRLQPVGQRSVGCGVRLVAGIAESAADRVLWIDIEEKTDIVPLFHCDGVADGDMDFQFRLARVGDDQDALADRDRLADPVVDVVEDDDAIAWR